MTTTIAEDPVRRVLSRLRDVHHHTGENSRGEYWTALCPAHSDEKRSLSIGRGRKGCVVHCHAGCTQANVVGALDLELRDLFDADRATFDWNTLSTNGPGKSAEPSTKVVAIYPYHDENGALLYESIRKSDKSFALRRPDGNGAYEWSLPADTRHVLYHLPDVLAAVQRGDTVFVVEGEKDANRLAEEGLTATTNIKGAGKWRREYAEPMRDANVVVIPDNDDAGRAHARTVCESLVDVAAEVRVLELAVPPKGDVSDWLDDGGTVDGLAYTGRVAPLYDPDTGWPLQNRNPEPDADEPSEKTTERDEDTTKPKGLPAATRLSEALAPTPPDFSIESFWTRGEIGFAASDGGVGKTSAAVAIGGAVAGGYPVFDTFEVRAPGPVLFVSEEDSLDVIHNRLDALCAGHGWDAALVKANFHVLALEGASLDDDKWKLHLMAEAERVGAMLLIFDPLADLTGAEKNEETRPIKLFLRAIARRTGASILICHHIGKVIEGRRKLDMIRGATAWVHGCRIIWFLEQHDVGIRFECLKLSRTEKPAPFVVTREVDVDAENPASWTRARLTLMPERTADDMAAEDYVLGQLHEHGEQRSGQLRDGAATRGIDPVRIAGAVKHLHAGGRITFNPGPRGAKLWRLSTVERNDG